MPSLSALIAHSIRTIALVSPALAGALAYRAFFSTAPRMPVRPADAPTHADGRRDTIVVRGTDVTTYEWGRGDRTVLLLHGWRGRASQFAPLVRELVFEGFRVVSFDAPAHGASKGRHADVRDWVAAAEQLQAVHGPFAAIVGHSFGGFAALTAARSSVPVPAVAVIAGGAGPAAFIAEFSRQLGLDRATTAHMTAQFRRRLQVDETTIGARYDAAQHPLPLDTALLVVHDRGDRRMPDDDSLRLHAAHGGRSRLLRVEGFGHTRVLSADATIDAVVALAVGGLDALDDVRPAGSPAYPAHLSRAS
ncbi:MULTISPECIES: S9 family peptidase [unclassified Microbacterium]|uniref:alpha/beta hydrolase family protein n=1 Tax=unclassified Microbacterium TaxID=2609290 RepID=UPI000EA93920|nr:MULTISPECIES: alpha/beta hydrolase [unclassified Microbacterium]MBT2483869.1 alpha/beta hydrolase [Microbacterium sp. ISL-108]RKN66850.1 alpha/beta hydrolase [Microbacterium sp. CGR2]